MKKLPRIPKLSMLFLCTLSQAHAYNLSCYERLTTSIEKLPIVALVEADSIHPSTSNVLDHFVRISKIARPSGHEEALRLELIKIAISRGYSYQADAAGNLLIRIPANGAADNSPTLLLQSHMDIVPNVKGITKLSEAEAFYHQNGGVMPLEWIDGNIQSKNQNNTIGADDGSGVAIMMEYLLNPDLKHPPLELLFTVAEETGLLGLQKLELPLTASYALSLDSGKLKDALIGSLGCSRFKFEGAALPRKPRNPNSQSYRIQLSGLEGGHSAMKIGLGRANAVLEMKNFLFLLKKEIPELELLSVEAGTEGTYNAIPSTFNLDVALNPTQTERVRSLLKKFDAELREQFKVAESFKEFKFEIKESSNSQDALDWNVIETIITSLTEVPYGPVNANWPKDITDPKFSSNTAFITIDEKGIRSGFMPRFADIDSHKAYAAFLEEYRSQYLAGLNLSNHAFGPAWTSQKDSELNRRVMRHVSALGLPTELSIAMGGVEASLLAEKFPEMQIIVLGVDVLNPHEVSEAMPLTSLAQTLRLVDDIVRDFANNP